MTANHNTGEQQRNLQTIRRHIFELWQDGCVEIVEQLFHPSFVDHNPSAGSEPDLRSYLAGVQEMQRAFSDHSYEVLHLHALGDLVIDHWRLHAIHSAEFAGVEASGRAVSFCGTDIFRMRDGRIAEIWHTEELLQLEHQLQSTN